MKVAVKVQVFGEVVSGRRVALSTYTKSHLYRCY